MRNPRTILRLLATAAAIFLLVAPSQAYYHYVHFLTGKGPYIPVPEAFDLSRLQNNTIAFFASTDGPVTYGPNDSWGSVLSEVKQAAAAWNSVASSNLRVTFNGVETYSATPASLPPSTTPGGDVVFSELPPGLLGLGTPVVSTAATVQTGPNGQFFPISRGLVILTDNTTSNNIYGPGPSYLEEYYTTAVHEFGHALGLQHTWTASAMSQDVIRNTSRSRPVDADDIAAITELYGKANWSSNFGSISGRVTLGNAPVNLASVVAIPAVGPAVSALTNPDGTYTINGLPPGQYQLYVHPLPPDAIVSNGTGLTPPVDANGAASFARSGYFQTVFFVANGSAGTTDPTQATSLPIAAGQSLTGENFTVLARTSVPVYDLVTYCYLDPVTNAYTYNNTYAESQIWMTPAFVSTSRVNLRVYAQANSGPTPMPSVATVLGADVGNANMQLFPTCLPQVPCDQYLVMDFQNNGARTGPRHLVLTYGSGPSSDMYVLPDAFTVVAKQPPTLTSITTNPDGSLSIGGTGLTPDSRIFFDGLQASLIAPFSATDSGNGFITVLPPDGASGQISTATAFEADGQNSMLLQSTSPVVYPYPASNAPQITSVTPAALAAGINVDGTASQIDIITTNTNFVSGQVTLGFGTSDISVRRVWVVSPTHLMADIVVANNATPGPALISVISGFQVLPPADFTILPLPPSGGTPTLALPIFNAVTYDTTLHAGDYGAIFGAGLAIGAGAALGSGTVVTLNGVAVPVVYASPNQVNFFVPAGFSTGTATLVVGNGSTATAPVLVQIDGPAPVIGAGAVANSFGMALDTVTAANPGDILSVQISNVDPTVVATPSRVQVRISGVLMTVLSVTQVTTSQASSAPVLQVQFADTQSFGGSQVPLVVYVDGSASAATTITAR